ncbi:hypothetical protein [Faecalibacterium sp. I3-3-89]|uniref:hypothetical protein n=1 Tax=Faecalibacterium sp. I3-3-89 TaxID=2929493 RepID=UPI002014BAA8|nr:hypothetical protein [Faecalibacterium sp. I3-3-89]UQK42102.1 hypothetical protein MTP38_08235 [Faecalibacterium sp. I3-3-89]
MGMLQLFQDCGAIIREIAGRVKRILDMPAMFVWYFKEENTLRFWRLCGTACPAAEFAKLGFSPGTTFAACVRRIE